MRSALLLLLAACGNPRTQAPPDAAPSPIPIPGRVAHYAFEGGALTSDPPGMDGACAKCPLAIDGVRGDAVAFDGIENEVALPSALIGNAPYTVSLWIRPVATGAPMAPISKPLTAAGSLDVFMLLLAADGTLDYETTAGAALDGLGPAVGEGLMDGAWHQIAATWDGVTKRSFVDGQPFGLAPATLDDGPELVYLGDDRDHGAVTWAYRGAIDELDFFDRALAPDELVVLAVP